MYVLGIDVGSSSVKVALVDASTHKVLSLVHQPAVEMEIISKSFGWAEQHPEVWWENTILGIKKAIENADIDGRDIASIGISYQMHGLVLVDKQNKVLRPSIIWCDSRAVEIGTKAFDSLGRDHCLSSYLNSPGNFTASKLRWVRENEPEVYKKIHKVLLPGDYISMKLSGICNTTITGLSEGVFWNFKEHRIASDLLAYYEIDEALLADIVPSIGLQGTVTASVAQDLGIAVNTPITYRAGDQANNAMSLGVLSPGQLAATGGTSGVVYAVLDKMIYDKESRINSFAHVNHRKANPRIGALLCINGAGIQHAWTRKQVACGGVSYNDMEAIITKIPVGSDGLRIIPFGNGAERMLNNRITGSQINNLQFNKHTRSHFYRAGLEGIAFSFVYGSYLLQHLGLDPQIIKAGNDNLFQSSVFSKTIAPLLDVEIEIADTNGAIGAAKASGVAVNIYDNVEQATEQLKIERTFYPDANRDDYKEAYEYWAADLEALIKKQT